MESTNANSPVEITSEGVQKESAGKVSNFSVVDEALLIKDFGEKLNVKRLCLLMDQVNEGFKAG